MGPRLWNPGHRLEARPRVGLSWRAREGTRGWPGPRAQPEAQEPWHRDPLAWGWAAQGTAVTRGPCTGCTHQLGAGHSLSLGLVGSSTRRASMSATAQRRGAAEAGGRWGGASCSLARRRASHGLGPEPRWGEDPGGLGGDHPVRVAWGRPCRPGRGHGAQSVPRASMSPGAAWGARGPSPLPRPQLGPQRVLTDLSGFKGKKRKFWVWMSCPQGAARGGGAEGGEGRGGQHQRAGGTCRLRPRGPAPHLL